MGTKNKKKTNKSQDIHLAETATLTMRLEKTRVSGEAYRKSVNSVVRTSVQR